MKKLINILCLIGVATLLSSILSSCVNNNANNIKSELYKKYNKEFEVIKLKNITAGGKGVNYDAVCYPKDNKSLLFEVHVYNKGEEMEDEYECVLLGEAMKKDAAPIINKIAEDYEINMDFTSYADGYREGMSAKEFNMENECVCYTALIINTDKKSNIEPDKLYGTITDMYREWGKIHGGIDILLADADEMADIREQLSRKAKIDSNVLDACDQKFNSEVENGILVEGINEMIDILYR